MDNQKTFQPIFKTERELNTVIINNVILMLSRRFYITKSNDKNPILDYDDTVKKVTDNGSNTYTFKASSGDDYAVKIIYQPILTTGKTSIINEFISGYEDYKKIIVTKEYNNKTAEFVTRQGSQIFKEEFFLSDIIKAKFQPTFELLSPKEVEEIKIEYNISPYTTSNLIRADAITKYFGLKKGDFIKVIDGSPTSGFSVSYRVVA